MIRITLLSALLMLTACDADGEGEPVTRARIDGQASPVTQASAPGVSPEVQSACRSIIFENSPLTHCLAIPSRHRLAMDLGPDGGAPYRSLAAFAEARGEGRIAFAMNAGMFDDDGNPIGYFVENSDRLHELNTADGEGNFHMKPNGVFYGTGDTWEIRSTDSFLSNVTERPEFGTQSGPMLVIDGAIHPDIQADGPSKLVRNAVGIDEKGRAHFVISNGPLSFGKLARFMRDELKTPNALYLDGNVSALWNPATDRLDGGAPIGPIVYAVRKETEE
ncbi:hypothetical protein E3U23_03350 [Erythrobacter litoralis]|uniref:phosphodiester glycosidase family protein n=1 Tax=Erythrobacter litoralis TaxID=39960 RepID=UPI002435A05B|nr:phosphodiester glycosidase family protein [Erythrobacter litoralis]MDG6078223.1 hypothetical protein [Erythrobacter litoralis]